MCMEDFAAARHGCRVGNLQNDYSALLSDADYSFCDTDQIFYTKGEVSPSRALRCALPPLRGHPATPRTITENASKSCAGNFALRARCKWRGELRASRSLQARHRSAFFALDMFL